MDEIKNEMPNEMPEVQEIALERKDEPEVSLAENQESAECDECIGKTPEPQHNEMALRQEWLREADEITAEKLPAFIEKMSTFNHSYNTIVYATAATAIAAAKVVNRGPQGGISGFQASCVMWEFICGWMKFNDHSPMRLVDYSNMLYPQCADHFTAISKTAWEWLQVQAKRSLEEAEKGESGDTPYAAPQVIEHWKSIVEGKIPFGYHVDEDS